MTVEPASPRKSRRLPLTDLSATSARSPLILETYRTQLYNPYLEIIAAERFIHPQSSRFLAHSTILFTFLSVVSLHLYRPIELCWMTWLIQPEGRRIRIERYRDILPKI
jgi:hypothetical protein